jgi:hypothetical protein
VFNNMGKYSSIKSVKAFSTSPPIFYLRTSVPSLQTELNMPPPPPHDQANITHKTLRCCIDPR